MTTFEDLVAEGSSVPVDGWDFGWFAGRATEQRPSWGYAGLISDRMTTAGRVLDLQTGGGEVLAGAAAAGRPATLVATEGWPPNAALARAALEPLGATVVEVAEDAALPFPDASFDLVVSRHPVTTDYAEVARVLAPGGTYLSQHVGAGSVRELYEFMMGPQPHRPAREPSHHRALATAAGLTVVDLRDESPRMEFFDVAAVIVFLRKVIWTVPGFTVERYLPRLRELHDRMPFVAHSRRFLIEAHS
ncbi:methyltransferase domain-containing protein [Actinoplanes sp. L3-i22]|uniref:methyltransferase domain-containing protein n=1 Tax=Actinoplanes sp. L3-i22 TaxID=2836373 RepID=UPI001C77622D|nr:methyltransferase domain-containing protein [Actinoplanes sp. L3-i22]BCY10348.1 methyltransferase type 11 [Actinoplanes sp. L3-i22]